MLQCKHGIIMDRKVGFLNRKIMNLVNFSFCRSLNYQISHLLKYFLLQMPISLYNFGKIFTPANWDEFVTSFVSQSQGATVRNLIGEAFWADRVVQRSDPENKCQVGAQCGSHVITVHQSKGSIAVTWSLLTNQRSVSRSCDLSRPIRREGSGLWSTTESPSGDETWLLVYNIQVYFLPPECLPPRQCNIVNWKKTSGWSRRLR